MTLSGKCNQCGLCCMDGPNRCAHLVIRKRLGLPDATQCKVYTLRYDGMPITMIDSRGHAIGVGRCSTNSVQEELEIIVKGIGRGCSLTFKQGVRHDVGRQ